MMPVDPEAVTGKRNGVEMRKLALERLECREMMALVDEVPGARLPSGDGWVDLASEPVVSPLVSVTRDAAQWPFAADSPWNTSLGSGAAYAAITSLDFSLVESAHVNSSDWSHPIYVAQTSDPIVSIYEDGVLFGQFHVPVGAMPDDQADHHLHIIDETHRTVVEMFVAERLPNGDIDCVVAVLNDLTDAGVYDEWHGARAYGGSAIAGLIRTDELLAGDIPHALAIAVSRSALNRLAPGGESWVWPASWSDGGNGESYGAVGNLYMGTLLAIPPDVVIDALPLNDVGRAIGHALQDYGAYIVDSADGNLFYYAEPSAADLVPGSIDNVLARLNRFLRVVENNSPTSVGGGGERRRDAAPPIGDPVLNVNSILGFVHSGVVIAGAKVNLYEQSGQWLAITTSDDAGQFHFDGIAPGIYDLTFEAPGYQKILRSIQVTGNETFDVTMWIPKRKESWWRMSIGPI
jgi:hypothetical protein